MATTYAYLVDPNKQYMTKSGTINVNGTLRVYDAATDDIVITYKDFNGTENEASIKLDNNGRAIVIADSARAYRLEVYDRYGSLQWTVSPLWCLAAGGGVNVHTTRVISTDGSIDVDQIDVGSTTTFDIGLAPNDSDEFLEWITCSEEDCGSTWYPVYQSGSMETEAGQGIKVHGGHLYHFTNSFTVDPNGTGINYDTFRVTMYCGDEIVDVRDFDIDSSLNDAVLCEFSRDVVPTEDTHVYFKLTIPSTCEVTAEVQCHRIYSGINAVPDSCAAKPWVSEYFEEKSSMSAYIPFSGLDYNQGGAITGISGSAIYAALDSSTVSAIASSYAESAISSISGWSGDFSSISSKIDWSSSGVFQPSGDYQTAGDYAYNSAVSSKVDQSAFEQCCDEVHSALDEKLDKSASSEFQPSGQYVYESSYSSFSSEVTNNISSLSSTVSGVSADMSAYVPFSGLEGEGGKVTGISGSAFKGHEYTGINPVVVDNTADTISVEHRTLCVDSTMTAYNSGSSAVIGVNTAGLDLSSKMDASASSLFYSTSNPSGFLTAHQSLAGYATEAYVDSSVSSKLDTTAFSTVSGDFLTSHQSLAGYATESYVDSAVSGKLDVTASSQFLTSLPDDLAYTSDVASAVSGKMDKSESSSFYPMDSNPSGYLTAHQSLAEYATVEYVDSSVSSKLDATAYDSAEFYTTANPSGFVDSAYVESQVSGKQNSGNYISAKGLTQTITNAAGTSAIAFGTYGAGAQSSTEKPGIFITGEFGTAYYKDNELNLNRADMKIAFNIGGQGPKISSMATGTRHSYMYLFASGQNSGTYSETGIEFKDSGNNTVAFYDSSTYGNITSVYDTVSANSANWGGGGGVDSATVSAIASSYAESAASSKLDASASSDFYSTANESGFVDSTAASAIASAYQVVSALESAKYAGYTYITGINYYMIMADRASRAYYDLAGRDISSLPDSAAVSAIASSYTESAVSSKQDASAMTAYQEVSGMTAYQPAGDYQPSGDYIYVSALGWAEV